MAGYYKEAIKYLKYALELSGNKAQIKSYIGMAFLKLKHPDIAVRYIGEALEELPGNRRIWTAYYNALFIQGSRLFYRGDLQLSGQIFKFIETQGISSILLHLYLAIIEREAGNFKEAISHYDEALKIEPEDPIIRFKRAVLLSESGRREEAELELSKIDIQPEARTVYKDQEAANRFLAVQHFEKGEFRKAAFYGVEVLKKNTGDPSMHLLVGESCRSTGDYEKAKNHFKRVLDTEPVQYTPDMELRWFFGFRNFTMRC